MAPKPKMPHGWVAVERNSADRDTMALPVSRIVAVMPLIDDPSVTALWVDGRHDPTDEDVGGVHIYCLTPFDEILKRIAAAQ